MAQCLINLQRNLFQNIHNERTFLPWTSGPTVALMLGDMLIRAEVTPQLVHTNPFILAKPSGLKSHATHGHALTPSSSVDRAFMRTPEPAGCSSAEGQWD